MKIIFALIALLALAFDASAQCGSGAGRMGSRKQARRDARHGVSTMSMSMRTTGYGGGMAMQMGMAPQAPRVIFMQAPQGACANGSCGTQKR